MLCVHVQHAHAPAHMSMFGRAWPWCSRSTRTAAAVTCWFMPCVRSAQPAHAAMRVQLRSRTAHLPVAHMAPTPTIGSFMTSSAIARRTLVSYVDHGGSQHRVVQHHEQQVGQREHGGDKTQRESWRARRRRSTRLSSQRALRSCVRIPVRLGPARSWRLRPRADVQATPSCCSAAAICCCYRFFCGRSGSGRRR